MSTAAARQHLRLLLNRTKPIEDPLEEPLPGSSSTQSTSKPSQKNNNNKKASTKGHKGDKNGKNSLIGKKRSRDDSVTNPFVDAVEAKQALPSEIARQVKRARTVVASGTGEHAFAVSALADPELQKEKERRIKLTKNLAILTRKSNVQEKVKSKAQKAIKTVSAPSKKGSRKG